VVRGLGKVQMDPTSAVARTEHLVLFSRPGRRFKIAELERMLWHERSLFEYAVEIVPIEDLAIHQETMRRYPHRPATERAHRARANQWLEANQPFRRYVLRELKQRGPLRARELENRVGQHWNSGGWTDNPSRHVGLMLDVLWMKGEVMIVGRDGQQRIWDLASRSLPQVPRLPQREVARRIVEGQLRARGVAEVKRFGWAFDGRAPGWERALKDRIIEVTPDRAKLTLRYRYAGTPEQVWRILMEPESRRRYLGVGRVDAFPGAKGTYLGAEFHCRHGKDLEGKTVFRITACDVPDFITTYMDFPVVGHAYRTDRLRAEAGGTVNDVYVTWEPLPGPLGALKERGTAIFARKFFGDSARRITEMVAEGVGAGPTASSATTST